MNDGIYLGGLPTGPDVRKLEAKFPDLEALRGKIITHEEVEQLLGEPRTSNRYKTVTGAWRRKVEKSTGIVIDGRGEAQGVGFRVLLHGDQVEFGVNQRRAGARRIRRAYQAVASTNEEKLTAEQKRLRDHEIFAAAKINAVMMATRKKLGEPPTGPALVDKPVPGKVAS